MAGEKEKRGSDGSSAEKPNWVEKAGLLLGFASLIVGIAIGVDAQSDGSAPAGAAPAKLTLVDLLVRDIEVEPKPHARLEVVLHNTGGELVVIDRARLKIRYVYELRRCASQGGLPVSGTYGVTLPIDAKRGDVVGLPLHQQVGPDEADRFAISLGASRPADSATVYLFELGLSLENDGPGDPLSLGTVIVSLPEMPSASEYYWTKRTIKVLKSWTPKGQPARESWEKEMSCWRSNTAILRGVLERAGTRSPALYALPSELVPPSYAALE